jgi:hypothetical protein
MSDRRYIGEFVIIVDVADVEQRGFAAGIASMLDLTFLTGVTLMGRYDASPWHAW